jgi:hypothetical protein
MLTAALAFASAGCEGFERDPLPQPGDPPTQEELRWLGPDAYTAFFLNKWRDCVKYAAPNVCHRDIYGGGMMK